MSDTSKCYRISVSMLLNIKTILNNRSITFTFNKVDALLSALESDRSTLLELRWVKDNEDRNYEILFA